MNLEGFEDIEIVGEWSEQRLLRARRKSNGEGVLLRIPGRDLSSKAGARVLFERELGLCRHLDIEGVIKALDLVESPAGAALVLADAPGAPLDRTLDESDSPLPLVEALQIGSTLARTLGALHEGDLVHRDLRPANILYDPESRRISLTGLGRATRVPRHRHGIPKPHRLVGDPTYLAPEATGHLNRRLDHRSDLYSLGIVLYELLIGSPPFEGKNKATLVYAHVARKAPDPTIFAPFLDPTLAAILTKLLAKAAEERYQSGLGLALDLERCLAELEAEGQVRAFEPGESDAARHFELPQNLFGREKELRWLQEAAAAAAKGETLVRLVTGTSGVGKTALIEEIRLPVLQRGGRFASATFDPRSDALPYQGVLDLLRELVMQAFGAPAEVLEAWRDDLLRELGPNLSLMTEVCPELLGLVDRAEPVPEVQLENTKHRLHDCVGRFLETLPGAESGAPLVLFLDDLQWADPASLELLSSLVGGAVGSLLLLGAYRDEEVGRESLLIRSTAELAARGIDIETSRLLPLAEADIAELIARTLRLSTAEATPLAELVYRKTAGNPFFTRTFLELLYNRRLLRLQDIPEGSSPSSRAQTLPRWSWDLEAIATLETAENVIDLVAEQLTELPDPLRQALALGSLLGKRIDIPMLVVLLAEDSAAKQNPTEIEESLLEACSRGLLVQREGSFAFVHDRIREGARELLQGEERAEVHLRIGRLLRDRAGNARGEETPGELFRIVDHLNLAAGLIRDPEERRELLELNAEAGRQARVSGAFPAAFAYLRRALELLREHSAGEDAALWTSDYLLARDLHAEVAEAASLAGDFAAAEELASELCARSRDLIDAVPAYETRIYLLHAQHDDEAAIRLSLDVLGRFGMSLPVHPEAHLLERAIQSASLAIDRMLQVTEEDGTEGLALAQDREHVVISRLLMRTALMASWAWFPLFRLATCRLAQLTASHGISPISPAALVLMADLRCGEMRDLEGGRRIGELGLSLARHREARGLEAICRMLFEMTVSARTVHPSILEGRFAAHYRNSLQSGDLFPASAARFQGSLAALLAGEKLAEIEKSVFAYQGQVQGLGQVMLARALGEVARLVALLRGRGWRVDALDTTGLDPGSRVSLRTRVIGPDMMVCCLLRHREAALDVARESLAMPKGMVPIFPFDFYRCVILFEAEEAEPGLEACMARLEVQARGAPELYQHKLDLARAQQQRAAGAVAQALDLYEQAIQGARRQDFPHEEALAHELAAETLLHPPETRVRNQIEDRRAAAAHLREALAAYRRWGAHAKVEQLFESYPDLLSVPKDSSLFQGSTSLDQAYHALATELDLERLLRRLLGLLQQHAGAQRAFLLRREGRRLLIDAAIDEDRIESGREGGEVHLPEDLAVDAYPDIAATVARLVARTQESVSLGEAGRDPHFGSDPYIATGRPRSILCFPLRHRGETLEIVYLENEHSPDAFTAERVEALKCLASPAAAALANARLYRSLEQEVRIRRRAEAELSALKNRLEAENVYLQEEIQSSFREIVGESKAMRTTLHKVEQVAATDATVLILGQTGTGKELVARALHRLSPRRERPLVKVNCAALPATLIESELFGHEKGAFTGALSRKVGRFELADSGTLFLDEIGDLPIELQAKLLRVLQEGELERLGGSRTLKVDVRILAATNHDLEAAMLEQSFRADLYYRLSVFPIELPPLRERRGDIPLLVSHFVGEKQGKLGKRIAKIPQEALARLESYAWPGNVRELENVVERALILSPGDTLLLERAFAPGKAAQERPERLIDLERAHIRDVLESCDWKVKGAGNAAERLGLTPPTLRNRMRKLGIVRPGE